MSSNKDERATQIFNSLLKKYIPDEELKQIKNKPKIYCKNKYRMKFKYIKDKAVYKGKSAVMFIPSRKWCRELAVHLKTDPYRTDYKEQ